MLSDKKCKTILETGSSKKYSSEEIKAIKELLYRLANIEKENYEKRSNGQKGGTIHQSIDG